MFCYVLCWVVSHQTWPLCPPSPKILGTSLKSARFHIPEGVWGQVPLAPHGRPCPPPENALVPCAPLVHKSWVRHWNQHGFTFQRGWGQVPLVPQGRPCPSPENALVPCAPLFQKIICWLHHCNQQLRELRNNWHLRATLHQVFVTSNISTVTHSIVARIVCHAEVICFAKKSSCRKSFVFVNESYVAKYLASVVGWVCTYVEHSRQWQVSSSKVQWRAFV